MVLLRLDRVRLEIFARALHLGAERDGLRDDASEALADWLVTDVTGHRKVVVDHIERLAREEEAVAVVDLEHHERRRRRSLLAVARDVEARAADRVRAMEQQRSELRRVTESIPVSSVVAEVMQTDPWKFITMGV